VVIVVLLDAVSSTHSLLVLQSTVETSFYNMNSPSTGLLNFIRNYLQTGSQILELRILRMYNTKGSHDYSLV